MEQILWKAFLSIFFQNPLLVCADYFFKANQIHSLILKWCFKIQSYNGVWHCVLLNTEQRGLQYWKQTKTVTYNRLILLLPTIVSYGSYYMCVSLVPAPIRYGERAKTGWLEIRIMCLHGVTCLSTDCCFSVLSS